MEPIAPLCSRGHTPMRSPVRVLCVALLPFLFACSGKDSSSPTGPSSTPGPSTPTRVIAVSGNLAFGDVPVGSQRDLSFAIANSGTAAPTVTGTTISGGLAAHTLFSFTNGTIAAGTTQTVSVRFQPTSAGSYSGTVTVNGDQTSGANTIAISGNATGASAQGTWLGSYIVERCDGTGSNQDYFCSQRGAFPPGASLPISLRLTQVGSSVTGTIAFGQVTGSVNGTVTGAGILVLQGTAVGGSVTVTLANFSVSVNGTSMSGNFTYNAGLAGVPGVAVVTSRLNGMSRQ
jgi:hypothetical protein